MRRQDSRRTWLRLSHGSRLQAADRPSCADSPELRSSPQAAGRLRQARKQSCSADHQQIRFENGDTFRDEFRYGSGRIRRDSGIHRVLEDMTQLARDFPEKRKAIGAGAALQRMRGYVETLDVFGNRIRILKNAGVLPQKLQVLGGFLEKDLDEFCSRRAHKLSCAALRASADLR